MDLKDKVVVVTGSNQGLGKVLAKKLAGEGAKLVLVARRENLLKKAKEEIADAGGTAEYFSCDIRDGKQVKEAVKKIVKKFTRVDILVNNAGVWTDNELEKKRPELRKKAFDTNVLGQIQFTEEMLQFLSKDEAMIMNVISGAGDVTRGGANNLPWKTYGATKWAMTGYTETLREMLKDSSTKVMQFFPGGFESNLYENAGLKTTHNQPWMMRTEDVTDIIMFVLTRPQDVYIEKLVVSKKR